MTERAEEIRYLVEEVGLDPDEAEARTVDSDLWIAPAEGRYTFEGEEGVRQLLEAAAYFQAQAEVALAHPGISDAVVQGYEDAAYRMREAARRARERLEATE